MQKKEVERNEKSLYGFTPTFVSHQHHQPWTAATKQKKIKRNDKKRLLSLVWLYDSYEATSNVLVYTIQRLQTANQSSLSVKGDEK